MIYRGSDGGPQYASSGRVDLRDAVRHRTHIVAAIKHGALIALTALISLAIVELVRGERLAYGDLPFIVTFGFISALVHYVQARRRERLKG